MRARTTSLIIAVIMLCASVAAAKGGQRWSPKKGKPGGTRVFRPAPRVIAQRNSALGDFRGQLSSKDQGVWDSLKTSQKIGVLRNFAAGGQVKWTAYLSALEEAGRAKPFDAKTLKSSPQNYTVLGKDTGHKRAKFTVVRDLLPRQVIDQGIVPTDEEGAPLLTKAEIKDPRIIDHSVSIATPNGKQPVWLHQVEKSGAGHLGRMVRDALGTLPKTHKVAWGTKAYVNMPGVITIPRLHAHGVWRGKALKVGDWAGFIKTNGYGKLGKGSADYQLYQAPAKARGDAKRMPVVAVADKRHGATAALSTKTDALLGRMILDVANTALKGGMLGALERGRIEIDSTDKQVVVRLYERPAREISE